MSNLVIVVVIVACCGVILCCVCESFFDFLLESGCTLYVRFDCLLLLFICCSTQKRKAHDAHKVEGVNRSENEGMRFGCTKWVVNVRYCGLLCCVICKRSKAEFMAQQSKIRHQLQKAISEFRELT